MHAAPWWARKSLGQEFARVQLLAALAKEAKTREQPFALFTEQGCPSESSIGLRGLRYDGAVSYLKLDGFGILFFGITGEFRALGDVAQAVLRRAAAGASPETSFYIIEGV